ncbi:MAG: hypothetical protein H5T68_07385 [Chloroflexi bacterium]|nr:hypothetical protein [Chloroflexota bacterium]
MGKIERTFEARLQKRPKDTVRLIVRVAGDLAQAQTRLSELNVPVLRAFQLMNAVAISCPAETALALLQEPWVQAIEEDRRVFAQAQSKGEGGKGDRNE